MFIIARGDELTPLETDNLRVDVEGDVRNEYVNSIRWVKPGVLLLEQFDIFRGGTGDARYQFIAKFDDKIGKFQIISIVLTREKPNDTREFWSIDPRGTKLKKLDAAPDWYSAAKSSPYFTRGGEEEAPSSSPTPPQEEFASPGAASESTQQGQHQNATALDAVADAKDRPPETIKAPDAAGEIFWRKGEDKEDPLGWVMWFRDSKSGHETQIGKLPGFPSFEPLEIRGNKDGQRSRRGPSDVDGQRESVGEGERANQFLFEGPLRLIFFSCHLDSTNGDTIEAFDFNNRKLIQLSPNWPPRFRFPEKPLFSPSLRIATSAFPAARRRRTVRTSSVGPRISRNRVTTTRGICDSTG